MIKVLLNGRLGNQMFQYAFAYSMSRRFNCEFKCVSSSGFKFILDQYFTLPHHSKSRFNYTIEHYFKKLIKHVNCNELLYKDWDVISQWHDPSQKKFLTKTSGKYIGYFQSESFFFEYKKDIIKEFQVKQSHIRLFNEKYSNLLNQSYAIVHVRRSDYLVLENSELGSPNLALPDSYFNSCLSQLSDFNGPVVFISDDIDYCKEHFGNKSNYQFESNSLIIDFQLILNASIAIISNSSFSWWAAYLNSKAKIYAPMYWLGFKIKKEYPKGVCCPRFTLVDFE